jgi:hypothetical protein
VKGTCSCWRKWRGVLRRMEHVVVQMNANCCQAWLHLISLADGRWFLAVTKPVVTQNVECRFLRMHAQVPSHEIPRSTQQTSTVSAAVPTGPEVQCEMRGDGTTQEASFVVPHVYVACHVSGNGHSHRICNGPAEIVGKTWASRAYWDRAGDAGCKMGTVWRRTQSSCMSATRILFGMS